MIRTVSRQYKAVRVLGVLVVYGQFIDCLNSCEPEVIPRRPFCQYGTLPGRWLKGDFGEGWNVYSPECQLQNFLGSPGPPELEPGDVGEEVGILLFGDSVDRFVVRDICDTQELGDHEWDMGVESFCLCR